MKVLKMIVVSGQYDLALPQSIEKILCIGFARHPYITRPNHQMACFAKQGDQSNA
jgi:hypothetical protein